MLGLYFGRVCPSTHAILARRGAARSARTWLYPSWAKSHMYIAARYDVPPGFRFAWRIARYGSSVHVGLWKPFVPFAALGSGPVVGSPPRPGRSGLGSSAVPGFGFHFAFGALPVCVRSFSPALCSACIRGSLVTNASSDADRYHHSPWVGHVPPNWTVPGHVSCP